MRVLLAGATGFTGRRIAASLAEAGHDLACFVRAGSDRARLERLGPEFAVGDLSEPETLTRALKGREALVYAASLGFGHGPGVVRATLRAGVERAVFFSTTAIFTSLPAPSRSPRLEAEAAIRDSGLAYTILRPTMIYGGPGDRNVERLIRAVRRWPVLPLVGRGERLIQPVLVDDLATAAAAALAGVRSECRSYSVPGRTPVAFREFVSLAAAAVGRRLRFIPVNARGAVMGVRLLETILPRPRIRAEQVLRLLEDKDFEWTAAASDFGYDPVGVEEGIPIEARRLSEGGVP